MSPRYLSLIIASVSLNALAQIFLRKAALTLNLDHTLRDASWAVLAWNIVNSFLLLGMLCYAVSIVIWILVLSKLEVSLAYPFLSIGYVITALIGYFFLGEAVTLVRVAAIGLICVGLVVLSQSA